MKDEGEAQAKETTVELEVKMRKTFKRTKFIFLANCMPLQLLVSRVDACSLVALTNITIKSIKY